MDNLLAHCVNFYEDLPEILSLVPGVKKDIIHCSTRGSSTLNRIKVGIYLVDCSLSPSRNGEIIVFNEAF
jgi:hypothetical protein